MSSLVAFSFGTKDIRVTDRDGGSWFILRDLLEAMETSTPTAVALESIIQGLGDGFNDVTPIIDSLGRKQTAIIVAESAATFLLSRSNTDKGRELNRFIHVEVLPSIRKTGSYQAPSHRQSEVDIAALKLSPIAARAAKAFGFKGNMATLSADNAVRRITGSSPLALFGQSALKAEDQDALLIVTEIANRLGIKAREVNPLLTKSGLQTEYRDAKGKLCYEMTETGKAFGVFVDTGKNHGDGAPVRQLKWRASVVTFLVGQVRIDPA